VLLLDEIEKAHPDVFNVLLQILDDGRLTDSQGRTVDFKHAVVIMTSNLGADRIQAHARNSESFEQLRDDLMQLLGNTFRPEFINRIDEIIVFRALTRDQLRNITRLLLDRVARRMHAQGIEIEFLEEAVEHMAEAGYDPQFGARPLRRVIQRELENELSRMMLGGALDPGQKVIVGAKDGQLVFDVVEGEAAPAEREPVEAAT
jgi:ATP-dependent Clp protease ATP-binding subunit ClpC